MVPYRRLILAVAALAVTSTAVVSSASPALAAWPGENGKIVFFKVNFANPQGPAAQIYSMDARGNHQTNLSAAGGGAGQLDIQPSVSPNGKRIAFARLDTATMSAQLWTMKMDGSHQTNISNDAATASESGAAWTEDGSAILFVRQPPGMFPGDQGGGPATAGGSIWIRKANGKGTPRQLTTGSNDANPAMSPDGDLLAFSRPMGGTRWLFLMKADGSSAPQPLVMGSKPDWSPDGRRIAYGQGGSGPIMVVKLSDPSHPQTLTGFGNEAPAWSPEGTQIAFMHCIFSGGAPTCNIALMPATGTPQHDITHDSAPISDQKPSWQPVGGGEEEGGGGGD